MKVRRDFYSIKKEARDILRNKWGNPIKVNILITVLSVIMVFIIYPLDMTNMEMQEIPLKNVVIYLAMNFLLLMPLNQGVLSFTLKFKRRSESNVGDVFDGYKVFFPLLAVTIVILGSRYLFSSLQMLLSGINLPAQIVMLISVFLLVVVECYLSQCGFLLCDGMKNPFKIVFKSISLMKGNVLKYIGLNLSFILWYIGSMVTAGILTLWFLPYQKVTMAVFYDELMGKREEVNEEEPKY